MRLQKNSRICSVAFLVICTSTVRVFSLAGDQAQDKSNVSTKISASDKHLNITADLNFSKAPGFRPVYTRPCSCGVRNFTGRSPRIFGGEEFRVNEFPWRVSINPRRTPTVSICAGSLISPDWILTAASCLYHRPIDQLLIDLGDHNLGEASEAENTYVSVTAKIIHEKYVARPGHILDFPSNSIQENDIALLRLAEPIVEPNIHPVCLPPKSFASRDFSGTSVITSAWGLNGKSDGTQSRALHKVVLTYFSSQQFQTNIQPRHFPDLELNLTEPSPRLTFTFQENKGIYPVDFGTGLDYAEVSNGLYYIIGIADAVQARQAETGATKLLGAWTDVTKYLDWIQLHTKGTDFCRPKSR